MHFAQCPAGGATDMSWTRERSLQVEEEEWCDAENLRQAFRTCCFKEFELIVTFLRSCPVKNHKNGEETKSWKDQKG